MFSIAEPKYEPFTCEFQPIIIQNSPSLQMDRWTHFFSNATTPQKYRFKCLNWLNDIYDKKTKSIRCPQGNNSVVFCF